MNLLHDPLISTQDGRRSLPGVLAALARGEVRRWPGLRPHQRPAWHMFLVQLSALGLYHADLNAPPETEAEWRDLLFGLTDGDPQPWALTGPDDRPAFLQPPAPAGLAWTRIETPDGIDMLITARNHDLKQQVAWEADAEDWIFALVSLQTMDGYGGGKGGYGGIARMNGGYSSRPLLGLAPASSDGSGPDPSSWWLRDLLRLTSLRKDKLEIAPGRPGGPALLWNLSWPDGQALAIHEIDPWFIEICRRIRLEDSQGRLAARKATSVGTRISAKALKGVTGDPWAPISAGDEPTGFSLNDREFDYRMLFELMFTGKWHPSPMARPCPHDGPSVLVAEAVSRGQSKTDGFKSRVVPVPDRALRRFGSAEPGEVAKAQMAEIKVFDEALHDAIALVTVGGGFAKAVELSKSKSGRNKLYARTAPARARFDRRADALFFPALWARLGAEDAAEREAALLAFLHDLLAAAREVLEQELPRIPCPATLRPRAVVRARRVFHGRVVIGPDGGSGFRFLFEKETADVLS